MSEALRKAVFLDRDGVLNRALVRDGKPYPPATVEEMEVLPGVADALVRLKAAGFLLIVVTNQPDVARGTQRREAVEAMNAELLRALILDEIVVCYEDGDNSPNKKPNPGMLLGAADRHGIDLKRSYMVGDRWRDVEAGRRAGCETVFLDYKYAEKQPDPPAGYVTDSLAGAADWILNSTRGTGGST